MTWLFADYMTATFEAAVKLYIALVLIEWGIIVPLLGFIWWTVCANRTSRS